MTRLVAASSPDTMPLTCKNTGMYFDSGGSVTEETPPEAPTPVQGIRLDSQIVTLTNGTKGVLLLFQIILDPEAARRFAEAMLANAQTAALNLEIPPPNGSRPRLIRP